LTFRIGGYKIFQIDSADEGTHMNAEKKKAGAGAKHDL